MIAIVFKERFLKSHGIRLNVQNTAHYIHKPLTPNANHKPHKPPSTEVHLNVDYTTA